MSPRRCHATLRRTTGLAQAVVLLAILILPWKLCFTGAAVPTLRSCWRLGGNAKEPGIAVGASAQSTDSGFLQQLQSATASDVLQLLRQRRPELQLAESLSAFQQLLELDADVASLIQEDVIADVLEFQVQALAASKRPPTKTRIALGALGLELHERGAGDSLLRAAVSSLEPARLRVAELRDVFESRLIGLPELRAACWAALGQLVHRTNTEFLVLAWEKLAEFQDVPTESELVEDLLARAHQKRLQFTQDEQLRLLHSLARLNQRDKTLSKTFADQAAEDITPYSVPEIVLWADSITRLSFEHPKLLRVLAQVTTWKSEQMSGSELGTMLSCFSHFGYRDEAALEDAARRLKHLQPPLRELRMCLEALEQLEYVDDDLQQLAKACDATAS
ncbi:unnamed protein product [Effrenium voratum]|nr:unnamed protein product [Effrenium voratum]